MFGLFYNEQNNISTFFFYCVMEMVIVFGLFYNEQNNI